MQLVAKGTFAGPAQISGLMSPFAICGKGSHFTAVTRFPLILPISTRRRDHRVFILLTFARDFQAVPTGQRQAVAHFAAAKLVADVAPELAARVDRIHGGALLELVLIILVVLAFHAAVHGRA